MSPEPSGTSIIIGAPARASTQRRISAGLVKVKTYSSKEVFEYENGVEFVNSPLIGDFLLPVWLDTLNEKEKERVTEKLAQLIDSEDGSLSFRFSVKVVLLSAEKA